MYMINIWMKTQGVSFSLTYKQKGFADEANAALEAASNAWAVSTELSAARFHIISDDYEHRLRIDLDDYLMHELKDADADFACANDRNLRHAQAQAGFHAKVMSDPKLAGIRNLINAMAAPRPPGLQS